MIQFVILINKLNLYYIWNINDIKIVNSYVKNMSERVFDSGYILDEFVPGEAFGEEFLEEPLGSDLSGFLFVVVNRLALEPIALERNGDCVESHVLRQVLLLLQLLLEAQVLVLALQTLHDLQRGVLRCQMLLRNHQLRVVDLAILLDLRTLLSATQPTLQRIHLALLITILLSHYEIIWFFLIFRVVALEFRDLLIFVFGSPFLIYLRRYVFERLDSRQMLCLLFVLRNSSSDFSPV